MTSRNIGFVSEDEQEKIKNAKVLVIGTGGMGGACIQSLVRCGIQTFTVADIDIFEVGNLNRQVFATIDTLGKSKALSTASKIKEINPKVNIDVLGKEWPDNLTTLLSNHDIIINGMDDIGATLLLYRTAAKCGTTIIDAYASPLPSVTVVRPNDIRPEVRLGYRTTDTDWTMLTEEQKADCRLKETLFVMANSSSANHFKMEYAEDILSGKRSRPSFAPMVITTGNLMAFEAIKLILGRSDGTDHVGYFFNPWDMKIERPYTGFISNLRIRYASWKFNQIAKNTRKI